MHAAFVARPTAAIPLELVTSAGVGPWTKTQDNKVKVLTGQGDHWTVQDSQGPDGQVTDAVLMPDHKLYLIAGTSLWQTTLS